MSAHDLDQPSMDFQQLLIAADIAMLLLDREQRVRWLTPALTERFDVHMTDRGRPLSELGHRLAHGALGEDVAAVLERLAPVEREVQDEAGRWYLARVLPHRTAPDCVEGVVITLVDVTERKRREDELREARAHAEQALARSEERLRRMFDVEGVGVLRFDPSGMLVEANDAFLHGLGYSREELQAGALSWRTMTPPEHFELGTAQLHQLAQTGRVGPYEKEYLRKDGSRVSMVFAGVSLGDGTVVEYGMDVSEHERAEQALRESEERYRVLAELSPDAILVNFEGRYVYANPAAARVFGVEDPEELVGRSPFEVLAPEHHDAVRERVRTVLEEHRVTDRIDYRWRRLDGSLIDLEAIAGPVEWGGKPAIQVVARDITERKRAEEALRASQEQRYRTLFESIDEGFCIIEVLLDDAGRPVDHRFVEVNPAFEKHTGLANAVGRRMRELVPMHEVHWSDTYGHVAQTGEPVRFQRHSEALGRHFDLYAFRIGSAEDRRVAVLLSDIIERKQLEEQLRRAAAELSEANRRKDEYLAMLGHELRNPLAAIRHAVELLERSHGHDPRLRQACGVLERQSLHMSRLIDGLLEVSRIVRGKVRLERETVDVRELVGALLQDRQAEITASGLTLEVERCPQPLWICGDKVRIAQVFDNLVGNAIKFTSPPGTIGVDLYREGEHALVRVRDTGVGIRPDMLDRIFESFHQEPQDSARSSGGLGLGLALAKELVALHGGTIEARSEGLGRGARFEVRLPLVAAPVDAPRAERAAQDAALRILVVEDNVDAAQMLRELLELSGHAVAIAENGPDALAALRGDGADVVLCDLGLPGMSGCDLAREIRRDPSLREIRLVALTGYGQPSDRLRTAEAGFDEHLTKPVDLKVLMNALVRPGAT